MTWRLHSAVVAAGFLVSLAFLVADARNSVAEAAGLPSCVPAVLRQTITSIEGQFGSVKVISSFRKGARIAGSGKPSYHASCRAIDFHPPRGAYGAVVSWLKANHKGGIGTYSCGAHHIHIDNGQTARWHTCKGGKSRGSKKVYRVAKSKRAKAG
jgi:uncharacterized protein YcbK (DUF882 family)